MSIYSGFCRSNPDQASTVIILDRQLIADLKRENKRLREVGDQMAEHILTVSGGGEGVLDLWAKLKP